MSSLAVPTMALHDPASDEHLTIPDVLDYPFPDPFEPLADDAASWYIPPEDLFDLLPLSPFADFDETSPSHLETDWAEMFESMPGLYGSEGMGFPCDDPNLSAIFDFPFAPSLPLLPSWPPAPLADLPTFQPPTANLPPTFSPPLPSRKRRLSDPSDPLPLCKRRKPNRPSLRILIPPTYIEPLLAPPSIPSLSPSFSTSDTSLGVTYTEAPPSVLMPEFDFAQCYDHSLVPLGVGSFDAAEGMDDWLRGVLDPDWEGAVAEA